MCVSLSLSHVNERETDFNLVHGDRFNEEEDGCSLSNSLSSLCSASSRRNHLCWILSFVAQATWSPLGRMVTHGNSHSSVQRARLAAACTSYGTLAFIYAACSPRGRMGGWYGSLTCRCAAYSPRGRCTSFTALSLQLCGVLAAELLGAVLTAYSLKAYSCDGRQRGKTQPACVNGDSHLAFSSTASHPHTLVIGISFVHLSLRLFSTAHHLYEVTIITPTWKHKRLITLPTIR